MFAIVICFCYDEEVINQKHVVHRSEMLTLKYVLCLFGLSNFKNKHLKNQVPKTEKQRRFKVNKTQTAKNNNHRLHQFGKDKYQQNISKEHSLTASPRSSNPEIPEFQSKIPSKLNPIILNPDRNSSKSSHSNSKHHSNKKFNTHCQPQNFQNYNRSTSKKINSNRVKTSNNASSRQFSESHRNQSNHSNNIKNSNHSGRKNIINKMRSLSVSSHNPDRDVLRRLKSVNRTQGRGSSVSSSRISDGDRYFMKDWLVSEGEGSHKRNFRGAKFEAMDGHGSVKGMEYGYHRPEGLRPVASDSKGVIGEKKDKRLSHTGTFLKLNKHSYILTFIFKI